MTLDTRIFTALVPDGKNDLTLENGFSVSDSNPLKTPGVKNIHPSKITLRPIYQARKKKNAIPGNGTSRSNSDRAKILPLEEVTMTRFG